MPTPQKSHDLNLPDWGPYTKRYTGISHIPDIRQGLRFDLSVIPGYYRRQVLVPNAKWESGHHAWEAAPDLNYYAYRYELEWKDQVYCDVSFSRMGANSRLIRCEFVNNTGMVQNLVLHYMAYMNFPPVRPYSDEPVEPVTVKLPEGGVWVEALDYADLRFAQPRPTDNLGYDGMLRAEIRKHGLVNGSGMGMGFGQDAGDLVLFRFNLAQPIQDAALLLRWRLDAPGSVRFNLEGLTQQTIDLSGDDSFSTLAVPVGDLSAGEQTLKLTSLGGSGIELDGFALVPASQVKEVSFVPHTWTHAPEILEGPRPQSLILKYADTSTFYGIAWNYEDARVRQILAGELDRYLRHMVHEHVATVLKGPGEGHFTNIFMRPITIAPHASQVIYGMTCAGSRQEVEQALAGFDTQPEPLKAIYQSARQTTFTAPGSKSGEPYKFSQERMAATLLTNVVYPVYTRRSFIRHNTPGKWWDCLYTWDSGFIGLGLLELDVQRAVDCLNAYVTDPGDDQAAFIHHGSMVPVQMYLFHELWNRTLNRNLLAYFYPRLRQYYLFYSGHLGSSTTRVLKSNLLKTWDYFYNSGGWDDYPPQVHTHRNNLTRWVAPASNTAHAIRSARILRAAALELGQTEDISLYDEDIATFSHALQTYCWDDEAGYFSYVVHNDDGTPREFLRHESGANFNMGMDGVSPLYTGICTPMQEKKLVDHLFSPEQMWSPIGLSTVDQTAPYYRHDGYWNGAVWMPHQWFFWKGLLDLGYGSQAHQIAKTALDLWKKEVDSSYFCFEHFIVQSGRGAGWHQFGGLSAPVLSWYSAYHRPGRLTVGFDTWVESEQFSDQNQTLEANLRLYHQPGRVTSFIAAMQPGPDYRVQWNDQDAVSQEIYPGILQIDIPTSQSAGNLTVRSR